MTCFGVPRPFFSFAVIFSVAFLPSVFANPALVERVDLVSEKNQYLRPQNDIRAQHGAAPLKWTDNLAAKAQQWANNCIFQHSAGQLGPFGENLAAGPGEDIAEAISSWKNEASDYDPNNPQPSHFTQVVWKSTSKVGCANAKCNDLFGPGTGVATLHVCEYNPAGNVVGQFRENVQP